MKNFMLSPSVKMYEGITCLRNKLVHFGKNQDGVTAIEYAVIAVAVSAMLLTVFGTGKDSFVTALTEKFSTLSDNIKGTVNK